MYHLNKLVYTSNRSLPADDGMKLAKIRTNFNIPGIVHF